MPLKDDVGAEIDAILSQAWDLRDGQVVPATEDVTLAGGGVNLKATIAYADLADSTELAMDYDARVAAKVFRSFLAMSTRILRNEGGAIRSFDGDRVMGIFVGDYKNSSATKASLKINWAFLNLLKPRLLAKYPALANGAYKLLHCVGIDTSGVLAVRAGIRGNNDLVWVGRSPNVAAKLSALRDTPYHTFISGEVYDKLAKECKESSDGRNMWEERAWTAFPRVKRVYRSEWTWCL